MNEPMEERLAALLRAAAPEGNYDVERGWVRLAGARRRRWRSRILGVGAGLVAASVAILLLTGREAPVSGVASSPTAELESWVRERLPRLDPRDRAMVLDDLATVHDALRDLDAYTPASLSQSETRDEQRRRMHHRHAHLLMQAVEQIEGGNP